MMHDKVATTTFGFEGSRRSCLRRECLFAHKTGHQPKSGRGENLMRTSFWLAGAAALALVQPAFAADSIKIGFVSTFSGPTAVIGNDMRNSFELALDHMGRKMGGTPVGMG